MSKLTYQIGGKDQIIAHLIEDARALDHSNSLAWLRRRGPRSLPPTVLADLIDAVLDEASTRHHRLNLFFLELLQASAWDEAVRPGLRLWMTDRLMFWRKICRPTEPSAPVQFGGIDLSDLVHAATVDELSFSLALNKEPAYRLLRKQSINRLCAGFPAKSGDGAEEDLFHRLFEDLGATPGGAQVDHSSMALDGWREDAVAHIAKLVTTRGVGAVTHRAVAAKLGVASSTLAYWFPARENLVVGGLEFIIRTLQSQLAETTTQGGHGSSKEPDQGLNIARATFAVALAATRIPALSGCAADMRRRRGINLHKVLETAMAGDARLDRVTAQALSLAMVGAVMTRDALGPKATSSPPNIDLAWAGAVVRETSGPNTATRAADQGANRTSV